MSQLCFHMPVTYVAFFVSFIFLSHACETRVSRIKIFADVSLDSAQDKINVKTNPANVKNINKLIVIMNYFPHLEIDSTGGLRQNFMTR